MGTKLKHFIALLSGFRKLLLAALVLGLMVGLSIIVLGLFIVNWKLNAGLITGQHLVDLYIAAFKYSAAVAVGYMGANVCTKAVYSWLTKKKK